MSGSACCTPPATVFEVLLLYDGKHKCFMRTAVLVQTKALTNPVLVCNIISKGALMDKKRTGRVIPFLNTPSAILYFQPDFLTLIWFV